MIPYLRIEILKNHNLSGGTYLSTYLAHKWEKSPLGLANRSLRLKSRERGQLFVSAKVRPTSKK